ncbi:FAD-dependent oxidoreductase [Thermus scotoductus]|uniref:FAD-dependent oxidoreductase n=1 Tax=Thermus scotoductus TaxID=37636 RepID=UPI000F80D071|nr:FAD-dependent oxidoreductase [Thermus scotoductus]RTI22441.1 hypothetical protein CSW19_04535 [Thermus scotoductus]
MTEEKKLWHKGGGWLLEAPERVYTPEDFDESVKEIARTTRTFAEREVLPLLERMEHGELELNVPLMRKAGELGLLAIEIPEEYGGLDLPKVVSTVVAEELAGTGGFSVTYGAHTSIGTLPLVYFGTEEQKRKYLPKLASGEWIAAYCLTEPGSGSDALAAKTRATLSADGKHYILNGVKQWISNAGFANLFTVFAKVDGEHFTAFLVERDTPGLSFGPEEKKMGIKASSTRQVILEDVKVPVENVLGEIGKGHKIAFNVLNVGRYKLGAERVVAFLREKDPLLFGTARLAQVAPLLYIRESRHLKALYRLRAEEVLLGKDFPDAVALGAYPLDGQAYFPGETPYLLGTPAPYGVPFRTLVPREVANLLVVSQAAGFDSVAAFSARVVPLQMALGEAAGVAAALLRLAPQAGLERVPMGTFQELAASPNALEALRKRLLERGGRLSSREKGRAETDRPGYREAVSLLRRGLFAGPYYLKGTLGLSEPILLGDFLANLEHYYRAKGPEERLRVVLKARELYREELHKPLRRPLLNQILQALGESPLPGEGGVSRGEAAKLLSRLLP